MQKVMIVSDLRLRELIDRFEMLEARLATCSDGDAIAELAKQCADLSAVADKAGELLSCRAALAELSSFISGADPELATLAREEKPALAERLGALEREMQLLLLPRDEADSGDVVLEVRAGTGGDEAALFAGAIFRMYSRHATLHGWSVEVLSLSEGESGGYKEIIASISGGGVYGRLKYESGVHRVQRVPQTESGGRIHTSAATVAVLPSAREIDINLRPDELRIDTFRASGAGGQHVNKTDSAVRITHIPTGLSAVSSEKSQHTNRTRAMAILKARLHDRQRNAADRERAQTRKDQVGSGDRSQRIRTYNFPQKRVSDHRIGLSLHKLDAIIGGEALDEIIDALIAEEQTRLLAATQE